MCQRVAIRAEGLTKALGTRTVLRGVNLAIIAGESCAPEGRQRDRQDDIAALPCGSGSTRRGLMSGGLSVHPWRRSAHRLIGMVAHESHLYPHLTLRENLVIAGRLHDVSGPTHRASRWLEAAGSERSC